jgi:hypothetical protein
MEEIRPGLGTWAGQHPEWTLEFTWGPEVRSYAVLDDPSAFEASLDVY